MEYWLWMGGRQKELDAYIEGRITDELGATGTSGIIIHNKINVFLTTL